MCARIPGHWGGDSIATSTRSGTQLYLGMEYGITSIPSHLHSAYPHTFTRGFSGQQCAARLAE